MMSELQAKKILKKLQEHDSDDTCSEVLARKLLRKFKLKVDQNMTKVEYINKTIGHHDPEVWVHNLHHYLIAPPSRRLKAEFGLGTPPDMGIRKVLSPIISEEEVWNEEDLASTLDWIVAVENEYGLYSVDTEGVDAEMIQELYRRKLITIKGKPTFFLSK